MKVVLLAGGFGTRISEESHLKPKPMVEIGGMPILWHIMKQYSYYGFNEFVICCGYKQHVIKEFFADYYLHRSDVTFDFTDSNKMIVHNNVAEPWKVTLVDTGLNTMTGGRIRRIKDYVGDETFLLTYGDGVSNINISDVVEYHKKHGKMMTMSAYNVGQRFGVLEINKDGLITAMREKSIDDGSLINIGFMVVEPEIFDYIEGDSTVFEQEPIKTVSEMGQLMAYKHDGFWQCMDYQSEREYLNKLIKENNAPWMRWK